MGTELKSAEHIGAPPDFKGPAACEGEDSRLTEGAFVITSISCSVFVPSLQPQPDEVAPSRMEET